MEWRTARFGGLTARALRQCHTRYVLPAPVLRRQNTRARRARGKPFHLLLKPVFNGDGVAEAMLNLDVIIDADAMSVAWSAQGRVSRASPGVGRCATVREMKEGPSGSAIRC